MAQTGRCQCASHRGLHIKSEECINWWLPEDEKAAFEELLKLVYKRPMYARV